MATLDSSCGSPGCLNSIRSFLGNYQNSQYQQQCEQSHQLNERENFHTSLPKYIGFYTQQMPTPHQHSFMWNSFNVNHQCGTAPIKPVTYTQPGNSGYPQPQYVALQKPCSNAIYRTSHSVANATDWPRNYWVQKHIAPTNYAVINRQQNQRQSSVEYLPEGKQYFIKSDHRLNYSGPALSFSNGTRGSSRVSSHLDDGSYSVNYCKANHSVVEDELSVRAPPVFQNMMQEYHPSRHRHSNNHCTSGCCIAGSSCGLVNKNKLRILKPVDMISESKSFHKFQSEHSCEPSSFNEKKSVSFEEDMETKIPPPLYFSEQCNDEPLILTENYRPISPPAEYAGEPLQYHNVKVRYNFSRSYSQSQEKTKSTATIYNVNNHKSLPDLHTQSNRYSPHSEILSCCSRGNRSAKSTGESSVNRDSGGSSGHYTHRSEPCYRQYLDKDKEISGRSIKCYGTGNRVEFRRDSGSSTQHSNNSYCDYVCKNTTDNYNSSDYLLNFPTLVVPEAFQDNYIPPPNVSRYHNYDNHYKYLGTQCHSSADTNDSMKNDATILQLSDSIQLVEDLSPPPMEFKRQRCIRFKNHNRISFPTSDINEPSGTVRRKSDIHRYFFPKYAFTAEYPSATQANIKDQNTTAHNNRNQIRSNVLDSSIEPTKTSNLNEEPLVNVEQFFDRLGLKEDEFYEIYANNNKRRNGTDTDSETSTIFFSEVSTVDSTRLPDSTETQTKANMPYRATAPLSVVERNARIIKWLCNMLKA